MCDLFVIHLAVSYDKLFFRYRGMPIEVQLLRLILAPVKKFLFLFRASNIWLYLFHSCDRGQQ